MLSLRQVPGIAPRGRSSNKLHCSGIASQSFRASTYATEYIQPEHSCRPVFINKNIAVNPLEWGAVSLNSLATRLDLHLSGWEVGKKWLPPATGAVVGMAVGLGVSPIPLLASPEGGSGLQALFDALDIIPGTLTAHAVFVGVLALSLSLAVSHLRIWWLANITSSRVGTEFTPGPCWQIAALVAARGACLVAAALALSTIPPPAAAGTVPTGVYKGAALVGVSLLLLPPVAYVLNNAVTSSLARMPAAAALHKLWAASEASSPTPSPTFTQPMAVMVLGDIAYMVLAAAAAMPVTNVVRAVAAAALAASLSLAAASPALSARLHSLTVAAGDEVAVHVSVALDNGILMDTTMGGEPLRFTVGAAAEQLGGGVSSACPHESSPHASSRGQAASMADALGDIHADPTIINSETANNSAKISAASRRQRFHRLAGVIDTAVVGALQGQKKVVTFYNPPLSEGGFVNPALTWWQETEDVKKKFKKVPQQGQVFFYPIRPDEFVPVRVGGSNSKFVELDANYALEGLTAMLHVQVEHVKKAHSSS